jgi:hypothetical protein
VISGTISFGCEFEVKIDFSDILPSNAGGKLVLSERLGFETQLDFLKFFARVFGLTFVVDERTNHVFAYSLQLLYDNIKSGNVKDWSDKLDRRSSGFSFILKNYARENIVSFEDSKDGVTDAGRFYVDNKTLKGSTEVVKLPVEAGVDIMVESLTAQSVCAAIPLAQLRSLNEPSQGELALDYFDNATFPNIKPHLLELKEKTANITFLDAVRSFQIANHFTAQQVVDMSYSVLQNKMLKNVRMIEDDFYLTPEDMAQFDPSIPVYIDRYGAYFYVNKIRNFEVGKLTTCEMVRL